ncbi:hypothetical protein EJD97_022867 [Solanum chilense]|uniref:Isopenicillin N synthase-like Fe(2+) 2OG dioxygenase domain-containing protein n=1 Tax=Solanum chilense TaxID=4083 RepID=A0A6N2CL02_SOLCI|nr:hypothetical protein EJD97_022867 [Solanum chilense]
MSKLNALDDTQADLKGLLMETLMDYSKHMMKLGGLFLLLLSKGLNLDRCNLMIWIAKGLGALALYYPTFPQPKLTIATNNHFDYEFLTLLLQDHIIVLQLLHKNQWVVVPSTCGALGHTVMANKVGTRVLVLCSFSTDSVSSSKLYGMVTQLLSQGNPPKYHATTVKDYREYYH